MDLKLQLLKTLARDNCDNPIALYIVKVMVAAAMADGHIDGKEYQNILQKVNELGLDAEEKAIVFDEINSPMSIDEVVVSASSPELAVEVYTASAMAIDTNTIEGQQYLAALAEGLELPLALTNAVHSQLQVNPLQLDRAG